MDGEFERVVNIPAPKDTRDLKAHLDDLLILAGHLKVELPKVESNLSMQLIRTREALIKFGVKLPSR